MNNTLCLMVFTALVFFRGLNWQFSAGLSAIAIKFSLSLSVSIFRSNSHFSHGVPHWYNSNRGWIRFQAHLCSKYDNYDIQKNDCIPIAAAFSGVHLWSIVLFFNISHFCLGKFCALEIT